MSQLASLYFGNRSGQTIGDVLNFYYRRAA
jgi:hypothetical protein